MKQRIIAIAIALGAPATAHATEIPFCDELVWEECIDDVLHLSIAGSDELVAVAPGDTFDVVASIDVRSVGIAGWSYGVYSDPSFIDVLGTDTLSAHALVQQADFCFDQPAIQSNNGFIQAIVLAFSTPTELPVGEMGLVMLASEQQIVAAPPAGGSEIRWAEGLVGSGQPVAFTFVIDAESRYPRKVQQAMVYP